MIDDLFDSPKKDDKPQSDLRIGFDNIRTEVFPYNIEEYSKVIIYNIDSPMLSEFSKTKINILNSNPKELLTIDPSRFVYDEIQYNNLIDGLYKKVEYSSEFIESFTSRDGSLLPLNPEVLDSFGAIKNAIYFYKIFEIGAAEKVFTPRPKDIAMKDKNLSILFKISGNLDSIKSFSEEHNDIISKRLI